MTLDKTRILGDLTTLKEDVILAKDTIFGIDIPIRELTARQRLDAVEAAKVYDANGQEVLTADDTAQLDNTVYWATIVQMGMLDAPGGAPLFGPEDVSALATKGVETLRVIATRIMNVSWLTQEYLFRRHQKTDTEQPPTGASLGTGSADAGADEGRGPSDGGDGTPVADEPGRDEGAAAE